MKAFLLYPDRDFDPRQLLARREREARGRNATADLELAQILPWNEADLTADLGLEVLLNVMAAGDLFLWEAAKVGLLSSLTDVGVIRYRQEVMHDCLTHEAVVRDIYRIAMEAIEGSRRSYWSSFGRYPAGTLHSAVEVLVIFVEKLKLLRALADRNADAFRSRGFTQLFAMLRAELSDDYFQVIDAHLRRLKFRNGVLVSADLGQGNKGVNYVLRKAADDDRNWLLRLLPQRRRGYTFQLHPRDEAGAQALSLLRDQGVNLVANAMAQSTDHILSFFQMLRTELAFYIGCANLHRHLLNLGEPACFPQPTPFGSRKLAFRELYDASLAVSSAKKVVGNDLNADGKDLIVVTGANTGGKSTFLRSLALGQLMMQAGIFVPAQSFTAEVREGLFTHYKREEDLTMESGKLDEELSRMSAIVDRLNARSMIFFNESFASTNEREGSEIASQVTHALLESGIRVAHVTHLYEFADSLYREDSADAVFLRADRRPDGTRPFRLIAAAPLQTSYGKDLYESIFATDSAAERQAGATRAELVG